MSKNVSVISLDDYKADETFVLLNKEYKGFLLKRALHKAGSQSKLATLIKNSLDYPRMKQSTVSFLSKKETLRLDLVQYLCEFTNFELDFNKIEGIKGAGTSELIYNPKLNVCLSKELAQILANLYCDGSIEKNNCYVSTYMNGYRELIERFKNNFRKCFGTTDLYERQTNVSNVRIPCFIGGILYKKFRLGGDRVPNQIKEDSEGIKVAYLQAVFDDEGSVHKTHGQIRIKMKPKSYIEDIQKLIQELGIQTSAVIKEVDKRSKREYYFLSISGYYNLKKFSEKIGFFHPRKKTILEKHLKNVKTLNYRYNAKDLVLNILKKYGPLTVKEIAEKLNRNKRVVNNHLNNLKKHNLVDYTKLKRKFVYEYLWRVEG